MDLIGERILVAVHSIENVNQDSYSHEVINITRNGSICRKRIQIREVILNYVVEIERKKYLHT